MKTVRIWFKKDKQSRYISHLDLNRIMLRAMNMAKIPLWHTQGFHPHPFITFALPLSVGMRSLKDSMDIRLTDEINNDDIITKLNRSLPEGIEIIDVTDPIMKQKEIEYASFIIELYDKTISKEELKNMIDKILSQPQINVDKKTKSGIKNIDIKSNIIKCTNTFNGNDNKLTMDITLNAGSRININPMLFIKSLNEYNKLTLIYNITRYNLFNKDMKDFC